MDISTKLESDDDERSLEGLLDAFGSVFSIEQIASAYCKAGRNPSLAGSMLYDLQDGCSTSSTLASTIEVKSEKSSESFYDNISEKPCHGNGNFKAPKARISPASMGTVSSLLGKGYARPMSLANGSFVTTNPLKLDSKDSMSEPQEKECSLDSAEEDGAKIDVENFLFEMLEDGFKVDRGTIRQVLGCCGYDMGKSMEKLLDLSATTLDKRENFLCESTTKSEGEYPKLGSVSCAASKGNRVLQTNGVELSNKQKGRNDIQKELLISLFKVPERPEELSGRTIAVSAVKNSRAFGQVVVEPLRDTTAEHKTFSMNEHQENEDDEEDSYKVLRRAVKEYRATMKEYYKAAVEAFAKGDHGRAGKLLQEGHFFHRKACEADEESVQKIFETSRSGETQEALSLDLHNLGAKEAIRLLKLHLSSFAGMPSIKYLKVIIERNDEDISKGARKRLIIKLLEKESIKWIEEGNAGTICIHLDDINPKCLSFAKK